MIPHDPNAITIIEVPHTPNGAEMLEQFRREQLRNAKIAWAAPVAALAAGALFSVLGWAQAALLAMIVGFFSGCLAPGLTAVFWLRRRKAKKIAETLPQLASARLLGRGDGSSKAAREDASKDASKEAGKDASKDPSQAP